jgi:transcriptional regulator
MRNVIDENIVMCEKGAWTQGYIKITHVVCLTVTLNSDVSILTIKKKALIQLLDMVYLQSEDEAMLQLPLCIPNIVSLIFPEEIIETLLKILL